MNLPTETAVIEPAKLRDYLLSLDHPDGRAYEILGVLKGPNGRAALIRTIWIVPRGDARPRLVTLIPWEER